MPVSELPVCSAVYSSGIGAGYTQTVVNIRTSKSVSPKFQTCGRKEISNNFKKTQHKCASKKQRIYELRPLYDTTNIFPLRSYYVLDIQMTESNKQDSRLV